MRAGLTGLGLVFLLTLVASVLFVPADAPLAQASRIEPGEPLAQLGVAPGKDKEQVLEDGAPQPRRPAANLPADTLPGFGRREEEPLPV